MEYSRPDVVRRVEAYINNVMLVLEKLREKGIYNNYRRLLEIAELYAKDAEYYLREKNDPFTALACIAYADGLIDSLRYLYNINIDWEPLSKMLERPKVLVAGSFEIIHPGHIYYLREAWKLGRVYVIVSRDKNLRRFKGRDPIVNEENRFKVVESIRYVYKAVLGDEADLLKPIQDIKPDIILLGPDQWPDEHELKRMLDERGLRSTKIIRLERRLEDKLCSTTEIIEAVKRKLCK